VAPAIEMSRAMIRRSNFDSFFSVLNAAVRRNTLNTSMEVKEVGVDEDADVVGDADADANAEVNACLSLSAFDRLYAVVGGDGSVGEVDGMGEMEG